MDKSLIIVCENCGSDDVESKVWYNYKTKETSDAGGLGEIEDNWCCNCQEHVYFTTLDIFEKNRDEDGE